MLRLVIVLFSSEVISLQKESSALSFHIHQLFMHRAYPTPGSLNRNNRQALIINPRIPKFLHRLAPAEVKEEKTSSRSYGALALQGSDLPRHWLMLHHFPKYFHILTGTAEGWGENPRNISRKTASK